MHRRRGRPRSSGGTSAQDETGAQQEPYSLHFPPALAGEGKVGVHCAARCCRMIAWQSATSRTASSAVVRGSRSWVTHAWNSSSSRLNADWKERGSTVRPERGPSWLPPSSTSSTGALRRKGEGKTSVARRSG